MLHDTISSILLHVRGNTVSGRWKCVSSWTRQLREPLPFLPEIRPVRPVRLCFWLNQFYVVMLNLKVKFCHSTHVNNFTAECVGFVCFDVSWLWAMGRGSNKCCILVSQYYFLFGGGDGGGGRQRKTKERKRKLYTKCRSMNRTLYCVMKIQEFKRCQGWR